MENASKALLMAGGILIGVLILALMVTLFVSSSELSNNYEKSKKSEAIQQFNVNFTQYLGQDLTTHEMITLCNFAKKENNKITQVDIVSEYAQDKGQIVLDVNVAGQKNPGKNTKIDVVYDIKIIDYNDEGYVSKVQILNRRFRIIKYNENEKTYKTEYDNI